MPPTEAPPAYTPISKKASSVIPDDQLWALRGYDIVYIVDDSSSMAWTEKKSGIVPWPHARDALMTLSNICADWDEDGQDIWFLNKRAPVLGVSPERIQEEFDGRTPCGGTNMGKTLLNLAQKYFEDYKQGSTKPVNILAITDGQFSDDVASVVRWIVQQLETLNAPPNQMGIQFVQIGADPAAKKCLKMLDDDLEKKGLARDIVDTVPWDNKKVDGAKFSGKYLAKVVCGAINKRLDADSGMAPKKRWVKRIFNKS
ncbi:hypothetical protein FT663_01269 [Candidozyma haemuli var. vulneris]|uniref:VWFA domain-containing protein n=1 Tax=Candidozyma haemuli TaxID=45357 RepID=A0A2V1AWZ1_9ASCO|nr:hypothetical protein CXQ85_004946 [[Candida] haemuloni]KAF3992134.1 hypothetical protein FT662_01304 [[Candida] haemuloni var. vulneris]KAF3994579.1 hypothetical protein FT663_01269 [[Candida] haemuloni var. vulneris]PVH22378.1 hypothetical protein CXQ85_004946 [[Candida] haemuloni]